jgi:hypothetical protein
VGRAVGARLFWDWILETAVAGVAIGHNPTRGPMIWRVSVGCEAKGGGSLARSTLPAGCCGLKNGMSCCRQRAAQRANGEISSYPSSLAEALRVGQSNKCTHVGVAPA